MWFRSKSKGQIFTSDLVMSAFVFLFILNIAAFTWNQAYDRQSRFSEENLMQQKAFQVTSMLVRTPGYPENWDAGNVKIVGLSDPDHVLQEEKVREFDSMSYSEMGGALGISRYDFFINVTNETSTLHMSGLTGPDRMRWGVPPTNADDVVVERRSVNVNTTNIFERAVLTFVLWK